MTYPAFVPQAPLPKISGKGGIRIYALGLVCVTVAGDMVTAVHEESQSVSRVAPVKKCTRLAGS